MLVGVFISDRANPSVVMTARRFVARWPPMLTTQALMTFRPRSLCTLPLPSHLLRS